jgi:C-terminal processing protease CtpA/Prc
VGLHHDSLVDDGTRASVIALLRIAGDVAALHPQGAPAGWDGAVEAACAAVVRAEPVAEIAAALLSKLADPATGVRRESGFPADRTVAPAEGAALDTAMRTVGGVGVFDGPTAATLESTHDLDDLLDRTLAALSTTDPLVLDLRGVGPMVIRELAPRLADALGVALVVPGVRAVTYPGYGDERGWLVTPDRRLTAGSGAARRLAVVIDTNCSALRLALGLRKDAAAIVVQHGELAPSPAPPLRIGLDATHVARIRTCEAVVDGTPLLSAPDLVVPLDADPVDAAIAALRADSPTAPAAKPSPRESAAGAGGYWSALATLDRAIRLRFPYHHLLDEPWEQVVDETADDLARASNDTDHERALSRAVVRLSDGHALLYAPTVLAVLGRHRPDIFLVDVEGTPIVAQVGDGVRDVEPGDEVVSVDGASVDSRRRSIVGLLPASTPQGLAGRVRSLLLAGAEDTDVVLGLVGAGGRERSVSVSRTVNGPVMPTSAQPVWTVLPSGVGYIDVGRLAPREVAPAFAAIAGTDAAVLDLRRYPRSAGMLVASRLAARSVVGARLRRRIPVAPYEDATSWWHQSETDVWVRQLVHPDEPHYGGKVVTLIDEGTVSQGEHTALFLEAATDTVFVGSPTNGTNGNVASVALGEGLSALYTGIEVTHGDGRQLQRVGVLPKVSVVPTREGLAARADEVLEAGVAVAVDSQR